jgi:hypothetical protein
MTLRSGLYALAFLLSGTCLFIFSCLGSVALLADLGCSASFGYYGCETPTANANEQGDQVALLEPSRPRGGTSPSVAPPLVLVMKARTYFLNEVLRHRDHGG